MIFLLGSMVICLIYGLWVMNDIIDKMMTYRYHSDLYIQRLRMSAKMSGCDLDGVYDDRKDAL